MNAHQATRGDIARDNTTFAVASAYARLSCNTRGSLMAFLAGPRHPVAAHDVAELVVSSTADADLVNLLARLLMAADADEAVEAAAYQPPAAEPAADCPRRRASDAEGRKRLKPSAEQMAAFAVELGVDLSGTLEERADRARAYMDASRVSAALAKVGG